MAIALRAEGLSKQYRLGATRERYRTLRDSVTETASAPFRAIRSAFTGKGGARKKKGPTEIWALRDVGLEINEGDVVGVIGRNGAGKSTLLKVLSKITEPTSGFAEVRGRVGSLLEVGTGFHNELTGRENIFLNGAILGMRRTEINRKFDEIVAFAEVEQFIDTPVKRYSSGMYLRLAFAVAAHLEPEILLVDEVLAVGDASFQKKCLGKLGDVAKEGRTVLFVSHNMGAVRSMCTHGIVLDQGMVREAGDIGTAVECYYRLIGALEQTAAAAGSEAALRSGFGVVKVDCDGGSTVAQSKGFETSTTLRFAESVSGFDLYCMLEDMYGREVFHLRESNTDLGLPGVAAGTYAVRTRFPPIWLSPGLYALHYKVQIFGTFGSARYVTDKIPLDVEGASGVLSTALLHPGATWEIDRPVSEPGPVGVGGRGMSAELSRAARTTPRFAEPRRLLVVSHALHYEHAGELFSYGPYVREIDIWADLFESVTIAAPFRRGTPDGDCLPFSRPNISIAPQREVGGDTLGAKLGLVAAVPALMLGLVNAMRKADAIHVRCPGNLGLLGAALAPMFSRYLVAKYAGQWNGYEGESVPTRLQRWLLGSRWWHGPVTVYGRWPDQPAHVVPFFTSMMTAAQVDHAVDVAAHKRIGTPLRVLFSGTLQTRKRVDALIDAVRTLDTDGVRLELAIVGDGPEREALKSRAGDLVGRGVVRFVGALPYDASLEWFEWAHTLVLPSRHSEGWPKVIAEGMCYGLVCVGVAHGQVPEMLSGRGVLLPTGTSDEIAGALRGMAANPESFAPAMRAATEWARQFSIDGLRAAIAELLARSWKVPAAASADDRGALRISGEGSR